MRHALTTLVLLATTACEGQLPPPPVLKVTSPARGLVQGSAGKVMVQGTATPNANGDPVTKVLVNNTEAALSPDGSFSVVVDLPPGAMLLETVAMSEGGGAATDARAVQVGELRPVGTNIDRAVTATLSADAFARLSAAAGPIIKTLDIAALLAPKQPMASLGDSIANLQLSITKLTFSDIKITLTPADGGLAFSAEIDGLNVAAHTHYDGALIIEGTTDVGVTADKITIGGTLMVTPAGMAGFTTTVASPSVQIVKLNLQAGGLVGSVLGLLQDNLASTVQSTIASTIETSLAPLVNSALGALAGPQQLTVMGKTVNLQATPSAIKFTPAGASVTMNLLAHIQGSDASPGYVFTPNGTPTLDPTAGIQLAVADDLLNQMLAEIHALGLLDIHLAQDFGVFDAIDIKLSLPPMVSANNTDGSLRLVLGDMVATVTDHGNPLVSAAINAQIDLAILRGTTAEQIALKFGKIHLFVNVLDGPAGTDGEYDLSDAAAATLGVQLDSLSQFLITLPLPTVAGVTLDNLSARADSGYLLMSGQIH